MASSLCTPRIPSAINFYPGRETDAMTVPVRKQPYKWGFLLLFSASCAMLWAQTVTGPAPPPTAAEETKETIHGVVVSDPYQWLEDSISARTRAWIDSQQKYTVSLLDQRPDIAGLRKDGFELADIAEAHRILFRAGHYFILKKSPGHAIASLYLRDGENGKEESLIDPNSWSGDHSDTIELLNISPDGK